MEKIETPVEFDSKEDESKKLKPQDYKLDKNLKYSRKGEFETTALIVMHPPNMEVFKEFSHLSQLVMRAISDVQNRRGSLTEEDIQEAKDRLENKDDDPMEPDSIKMLLFSSVSVDFVDVSNSFKRLACKVCYVSNDTTMTPVLFDRLPLNKFIEMVCTYIANFITPSLLSAEGEEKKKQPGDGCQSSPT